MREPPGGIQAEKQEPHTVMWGKQEPHTVMWGTILDTNTFTDRRFYTQTLLHTGRPCSRAKGFAGQEGRHEIAILPQFLAIEPDFVRNWFRGTTWSRKFTSVFGDRTSFHAKGLRGTT